MALFYRPFDFYRENAIFHLSAWKNQWIFCTKLGRRDYVGKIHKLTKFSEDRLRNGASTWCWNITVLWLSSSTFFYFFFRFLGQPTGRNFCQNCTLNGSKVVFRLIHVPFGGLVPSHLLWGCLRSEKTAKFWRVKGWTYADFLQKNHFNIRAPESRLPLNVKIPQ